MTTTPENTNEPADLSELTATDALLDRLGARNASDADLRDPTAAVLAELIAAIDQAHEPDVGAARLVEVLAGRPLYLAGADPVADPATLVIDLTEHDNRTDGVESDDDQVAASGGSFPISRLPRPAVIPIRLPGKKLVGHARWERALSHASLPAASVLLLLAVGGGVSAAVTGDPMTPVNGITRVMAQLPGVSESSLDRIKDEIRAARTAAGNRNAPLAYAHLNNAEAILDDVPDSAKTTLNQQIEDVRVSLPGTLPTTTLPSVAGGSGLATTSPGAPPVVAATSTSHADPKPSSTAAATPAATNPPATVAPTADPQPTATASPAEPAPSTQAAASDPTPVASSSP